jgi:predicted DsbA family dithiol-disulfide isomerase
METPLPTIEIYSSLECPYAYLATYRLRQVWPEFAGRVRVVWRALSLEYINRRVGTPPPLFEAEKRLFAQIEPALPWQAWPCPLWEWPVTMWPAFEALACAQVQGHEAAWAMSWALRYAFFAQGRPLSLRHELLAVAGEVATQGQLDAAQFEADWDSGRTKSSVIAESRRGWHDLKVNGSATFILPGGMQMTNPALGEVDFDEASYTLQSYTPYAGDPLAVYREMLGNAIRDA